VTFSVQANKQGCREVFKPPCLVEIKLFAMFLWEEESNLYPLLSLKKESLSEHHGLAMGWLVVNPFKSGCAYGSVEMGAPLSSFFTNPGFQISIFMLCILKLN